MTGILPTLASLLALAGPAAGPGEDPTQGGAWLPGRAEVFGTRLPSGEMAYTARGRHRTVAEFLDALVGVSTRVLRWENRARIAASETVVTVDLHERPAEEIAELVAAAAALDVVEEGGALALQAPPPPDRIAGSEARARSARRFYLKALAERPDDDTAARAHRGLADLFRLAGDHAEAAVEYDLLLRIYRGSRHAVGTEVLLSRSLREMGDRDRARRILFASLEEEEDPGRREAALRWLLRYLVEDGDLEGLTRLAGTFAPPADPQPETLHAYLEAGAALLDADRPLDAVSLLGPLWQRSPSSAASLAPVLGRAHLALGDSLAASRVFRLFAAKHRTVPISGPVLLAFADLAMGVGDRDAALFCAEAALRAPDADPESRRRARALAAGLLADLGLRKRALNHLRELARVGTPEESERAELRAASITLDLGKPEEARLFFQALVASPRVGHEARLGVVRSLLASGSTARTREAVLELLSASPPETVAAEALRCAVRSLEEERNFERARRLARGDLSALEEEGS